MALTRDKAESMVMEAQDRLFMQIDQLADSDQAPSDIARILDQASWGLGDDYRSWYEEGDEEWS